MRRTAVFSTRSLTVSTGTLTGMSDMSGSLHNTDLRVNETHRLSEWYTFWYIHPLGVSSNDFSPLCPCQNSSVVHGLARITIITSIIHRKKLCGTPSSTASRKKSQLCLKIFISLADLQKYSACNSQQRIKIQAIGGNYVLMSWIMYLFLHQSNALCV